MSQAIADYTGNTVVQLEGVPDPQVRGVFAFRALVKPSPGNAYTVEFLVRGELDDVSANDLEEVEFTCWPPMAKGAL